MKKIISNRKLTLVLVLCVITVCTATVYALTQVRLALGTIPFSKLFNGPADVGMSQITMQPGDTIAWHYHPGSAYGIVKSGTLTEDIACGDSEVLTAGQAFEEPFPRVHQVRNAGTVPVELFVTIIVPFGQLRTVNTAGPVCGPLIDDAQFFVRQQYVDFLNREPDANGLSFWTNEIASCGSNQQCIEAKRIKVSAAFFLSTEFQQTGYLVERLYKAAYGDANGASTFGSTHQLAVPIVRFTEFLPDTQQISQGVVVGQTGWETVLENNKQNLTTQFVQRSRFTTAFPTSMTPAQFVDKLNQNVGNLLSSTERATAIALFGGATDASNLTARAQALRQVAENQNLSNAEFNRALVLMQYFGYLRRNPNDLPDSDYSGFEFWLTKLNQFNGNFINAEIIRAFLGSGEYRHRFGP